MLDIKQGHPDDLWNVQPLTWRGCQADGKRTANVACGKGHSSSLSNHTIHPDGTVTPSLVCGFPDCTWHEHVRLLDWEP